jgi:hypothetical protein
VADANNRFGGIGDLQASWLLPLTLAGIGGTLQEQSFMKD